MFFPCRTLDTIIEGPHRHYRLKKGPAEEDVADEVLVHLLAPRDQGFVGKRGILPCPKRFSGLAYYGDSDDEWRHGRDYLILAEMANPFVCRKRKLNESLSIPFVEIPEVERYVWWLAKQRCEPENQIAEILLEFIRHVDQLMESDWQGIKLYDLKAVESDLSQIMRASSS